ncbi:hypothetical protein EBU94_04480 [bacterium]|nr:hypothetical protein [bacterium]
MRFDSDNEFYFLQILSRRKDNPDLKKGIILIKSYYIYSFDQFDAILPEVINICNSTNSRAYFRLNKRDDSKVGLQMIKKISDNLLNNNYRSLKNVYDSVVGEFAHDKDKTWLVDIDTKDRDFIESIKIDLAHQQIIAKKEPLHIEIPSKNGVHIITRPFAPNKIKEVWSVDIHKDNPTCLYIP